MNVVCTDCICSLTSISDYYLDSRIAAMLLDEQLKRCIATIDFMGSIIAKYKTNPVTMHTR